jgi:amidohydrolase
VPKATGRQKKVERTKAAAQATVGARLADLVALSHAIHGHGETAFEEHRSAEAAAAMLEAHGFAVETGICDLPTAFSARAGHGDLVVAICAEYDALPEIGHACGHNVIAASAVGAALGLAPIADEVGITVLVVGTPAEEGGGGKILLLDRGAFRGANAAMMVHPWPTDRLSATCLAVSHFDVHFSGKEAHAAAAAWEGVNAADAMTIAQVALGLLRQQLRPGDQVHGVVLSGGRAANVVPSSVTGRFMCRAPSLGALEVLEPRIRSCFEAGALATGASVSYRELSPVYSQMVADQGLLSRYRANAEALGRRFEADDRGEPVPVFSTDMANVSLAMPTIHPMVGIDAGGAVNHQPAFAARCVTPSADSALHDAAVAMAWTAIDAGTAPELRARLLEHAAS